MAYFTKCKRHKDILELSRFEKQCQTLGVSGNSIFRGVRVVIRTLLRHCFSDAAVVPIFTTKEIASCD